MQNAPRGRNHAALTPGTLHLIPVHLGTEAPDCIIPPETVETARGLRRFIVENAKTARAELKRLGHPVPLRDIRMDVIPEELPESVVDRLLAPLAAGESAGLMSDAGCPAVADPGAMLVRRAHELNIPVRPHVGPSSLLLALMASGLDGQRFAFNGYLPIREPDRSARIAALETESARNSRTQLFIETPYRNASTFAAFLSACRPGTRLCVATDLTLPTEMVRTKTVAEWKNADAPRLDKRPTVFLILAQKTS